MTWAPPAASARRDWPGPGTPGDLWSQGSLLEKMVVLDLNAGRYEDATAHLNEGLHIALRSGIRADALDYLDCCGYLCAMTGRCAEAVTVWAAVVATRRATTGSESRPTRIYRAAGTSGRNPCAKPGGHSDLRRARAAEEARPGDEAGHRGRVRSHAHPAGPRPPQASRARTGSAPGNGTGHPDRPGAHRRADCCPSCTSACARSALTWTASVTRPAAGATPTSPGSRSPPAWSSAKGSSDPCPRHARQASLLEEGRNSWRPFCGAYTSRKPPC